MALLAGPALGGALLASLAVSVATVGFELNAEHVTPKLERINPAEGLKKLFSVRPLVELGKALLVAAVVVWLVWRAAVEAGPDVLRTAWLEGTLGLEHAVGGLAPFATRLACVLVALGVGDYALARRRHVKDLMMTREDVKREHKESEGDPTQGAAPPVGGGRPGTRGAEGERRGRQSHAHHGRAPLRHEGV
jgi:type III secretion protein U